MLHQKRGSIRSVDLAGYMGYSKPSVSHAVKNLRTGGFLVIDENGCLCLTDKGRTVAEKIYERRQFFMEQLIAAGVDQETARNQRPIISKAERKSTADRLAHISSAVTGLACPQRGKKKPLVEAANFLRPIYMIPNRTAVFGDESRCPIVCGTGG